MKVKMFTKMNPRNDEEPCNSNFESEVNAWLQDNPQIEIHDVQSSAGAGSQGPFLFFVTIWYEE